MGFWDSMGAIGRGALGALENIAGQVLPQFLQAGTQFVIQKALPGASSSLPPQFNPAGQFFPLPTGGRRTPVGVSAGIPLQIPRQLPPTAGTLQQQIDQAAREGTGGPFTTPESGLGQLIPNIFQDFPFAQTFTDLIRAGVPPTLPAILPTGIFPPLGGPQKMPPAPSSKMEALGPGAGVFLPSSTAGFAGGCPSLFSAGGMSARPVSMFMVPNPVSGKPTFFKHAGRPILFSGDLRACKTVNRIAARARRVRGRR